MSWKARCFGVGGMANGLVDLGSRGDLGNLESG